ncbi:MAG: RNA-binding protein [Chitinophagaceae bacterium]|nr:RNA-binding protein [Chitinophagaceae bacterium]
MTLFVAGFPADYDEDDLLDMFGLYGDVSSAKIVKDRVTGKSKCIAFIKLFDPQEAPLIIRTLDGVQMKTGQQLVVKEAEQPGGKPSGDDGFAERNFRRGRGTE